MADARIRPGAGNGAVSAQPPVGTAAGEIDAGQRPVADAKHVLVVQNVIAAPRMTLKIPSKRP